MKKNHINNCITNCIAIVTGLILIGLSAFPIAAGPVGDSEGILGGYDRPNDVVSWYVDSNYEIVPGKDDTYDIGTSSLEIKDIYVDGIGYIDKLSLQNDLVLDNATAGSLKVTDGTNTLATIRDDGTTAALSINELDVTDTAAFGNDVTVVSKKATVSSETNRQDIQQGTVDITTDANGDGTATITFGSTFAAAPVVTLTPAETLTADTYIYWSIEDVTTDTGTARLAYGNTANTITMNYIAVGDSN